MHTVSTAETSEKIAQQSVCLLAKYKNDCICKINLDDEGFPYGSKLVRVPWNTTDVLFHLSGAWLPESKTDVAVKPLLLNIDNGAVFAVFECDMRRQGYICQVHVKDRCGTIRLKVCTDSDTHSSNRYFGVQISPQIGNELDPRRVCLLTMIPKWMGPLWRWDDLFEQVGRSNAGYNMIHFAPLQARGNSGSPYSISDHLALDPDLFLEHPDCAATSPVLTSYNILSNDPIESQSVKQPFGKLLFKNSGSAVAQAASVSELIEMETRCIHHSKYDILKAKVDWARNDCGLYAMVDVVWNHMSSDAPFLRVCPEAGYSVENTPKLQAAVELDDCILKWCESCVGVTFTSEDDVHQLMRNDFVPNVLAPLALWEYFVVCDIDNLIDKSIAYMRSTLPQNYSDTVAVRYDGKSARGSYYICTEALAKAHSEQWKNVYEASGKEIQDAAIEAARAVLCATVDRLNILQYDNYDSAVDCILKNTTNRIIYERVSPNGPRLGPASIVHPLVQPLFTRITCKDGRIVSLANNGWLWNADPAVDFAASGQAYLERSVIVWADCVKLRYGASSADVPALWEYMEAYTLYMAQIFDAFRIDNCHSTPRNVAKKMLDLARAVKPNLWVVAELFTGSADVDESIALDLGLDALIREAMAAWDEPEFARQLQRFGSAMPLWHLPVIDTSKDGSSIPNFTTPANGPATLLMDCTHDNEPPSQKRTAFDALSNSALVSMCDCAIGSVYGYDDIMPRHRDLVRDSELYNPNSPDGGMWQARRALNTLHSELASEIGTTRISVKLYGDDVIQIVRQVGSNTYVGLARCAFKSTATNPSGTVSLGPDSTCSLLVWAHMIQDSHGMHVSKIEDSGNGLIENGIFDLSRLKPGTFMAFKIKDCFNLDILQFEAIEDAIHALDAIQLNQLLYRCEAEERDLSKVGAYILPGHGKLPYIGVAGFRCALMDDLMRESLYANLVEGAWAPEYLWQWMNLTSAKLGVAAQFPIGIIKNVPGKQRPALFASLVYAVYDIAVQKCCSLFSSAEICVLHLEPRVFFHKLVISTSLISVQMVGVSSHGMLISPKIAKLHGNVMHFKDISYMTRCSMAAGLPHFSDGHMRVWGRDVFISLPGILLATGRLDEARAHLLAFASCAANGIIPNLLDAALRPRYNARDASWWFLRALRMYCTQIDNPENFLCTTMVPMRFPRIDGTGLGADTQPKSVAWVEYDDGQAYSQEMSLFDIVEEIVWWHAFGISFREWRAGPELDDCMIDEGFHISVSLEESSGLLIGGNKYNCGTWMDKMGCSETCGTKGVPATPRDGAPIEITALLADTLAWLASDPAKNGRTSVRLRDGKMLLYSDWHSLIKQSVPKVYMRHIGSSVDGKSACVYYADTDRSHQLRPNYVVAMSIAPWLFEINTALLTASNHLAGPLGMRTLDTTDPQYRPAYRNDSSSSDPGLACGYSYHQGPEWPWLYGHYIACLINAKLLSASNLRAHLRSLNSPHSWFGIPEVTDSNGAFNPHGCPTQAWSAATILEALYFAGSLYF